MEIRWKNTGKPLTVTLGSLTGDSEGECIDLIHIGIRRH